MLSLACGKSMQMMGDVFLARAQDDNNDLYNRRDILLAEFAPTADWVKLAREDNEKRLAKSTPEVVVSAKQLSKFEVELEDWLKSKLKEWDENATARKKHEKKHGTREA